jgi:hypothetical protein
MECELDKQIKTEALPHCGSATCFSKDFLLVAIAAARAASIGAC